jgi:hypothetical protein
MNNSEDAVIMKQSVEALKSLTEIQCSKGNWNHDPYMHGMANGMILALSLFERKPPDFLEAPKVWVEDLPVSESLEEAKSTQEEN